MTFAPSVTAKSHSVYQKRQKTFKIGKVERGQKGKRKRLHFIGKSAFLLHFCIPPPRSS